MRRHALVAGREARLTACLAVLLLLLGPPLGAASLKIEKLAFLPAHFVVGEEAEAFVLVSSGSDEPQAFSVKIGAGLPAPTGEANPELRRASLAKTGDGWELRIRFIAWTPGKGRLPALRLGGNDIPALPYEVSSVLLPGDKEPRPPKPQLDPPGTTVYLYGFLGFVLVLGLAIFALVVWVFPAALALLERRRAGEARKALARSVTWLSKGLAQGLAQAEPPAFYAALARALRLYLAERVLSSAPALTARELAALPEELFPAQGLRDEAAGLLGESEKVRYGGETVDLSAMRDALARTSRLGDAAEEALLDRL
jgi:hypothetical protein